MSDDEADPELLELLRQSLGLSKPARDEISSDTGVLKDAEYVYNNAIDVSIDMYGTKAAAVSICSAMRERNYSTQTWGEHELHPTTEQGFSDVDIVNFVFTMDLLNFSFWTEKTDDERFQVEYKGRRWTGYKSLVASLRRAIDEGIPITSPRFWNNEQCSDDKLRHIFRSATTEEMPLIQQRITILREAGQVLHESFRDPNLDLEGDQSQPEIQSAIVHDGPDGTKESTLDELAIQESNAMKPDTTETNLEQIAIEPQEVPVNNVEGHQEDVAPPQLSANEPKAEVTPSANANNTKSVSEIKMQPQPDLSVVRLIEKANHSAGKLVNILAKYFPCFRDETRFDGRKVRILKRAQILVADLWAAFNGTGYGKFDDIAHLTMFADYRVPQMLYSLGVLVYSPPLDHAIRGQKEIASGHSWEVQLRGCSIWAVELIRREIMRQHPEAEEVVNAVLIDFFLYDLAKEKEASDASALPAQVRGYSRTTERDVFGIDEQPAVRRPALKDPWDQFIGFAHQQPQTFWAP